MKTIKQIALGLLVLAVGFTTGCERHSKKEVFYLISVNAALPYWQTAAAGFKHAAEVYKVTARVVGPDGYDPQAEKAEFEKAVAAKPAGILVSVADAGLLEPEIDSAVSAGIPVITMDSDAPDSHRLYFIGTNNLEAGRIGGHRVIEKLGGTGTVVFFTLAGQPNMEERLKGFKDVFSTRPNIKIGDVIDVKGDVHTAFDKTQEMVLLTGPKKVDAFVCLDSASGKMVADALKRTNTTDRLLVVWDVSQETLDGIKAGVIDSTVTQKPYVMGYFGLRAVDQAFHAPSPGLYPAFVDTGASLVEKHNVDQYSVQPTGGQ